MALSKVLDPGQHGLADISARPAVDKKGGLCGLSALYWALTDTLYTTSQVATMGYMDMRKAMQEVMGESIKEGDEALLEAYHKCKDLT